MENTAPRSFKILGAINIAVGALLALVNVILIEREIDEIATAGADGGGLRVNEVVFFLVGGLLVWGGIGLLRGARSGRVVSLVAAAGTLVGALVSAIVTNVVAATTTTLHRPMRITGGGALLSPLLGIALLVLLNLRDARDWAAGRAPAAPTGAAPALPGTPAPAAQQRASTLAIVAFVLSMIPFVLVTQIVGLILGIVALRQIKAANGALGGRGFAIAGIAISSSILGLLGCILLLVLAVSHK